MVEEQCESAANMLLNDLRQRTDEYYWCTTQLDVQQRFILTVSYCSHSFYSCMKLIGALNNKYTIRYDTIIYNAHNVCQLAESEARAVTGHYN